jgi:hypothetical protein
LSSPEEKEILSVPILSRISQEVSCLAKGYIADCIAADSKKSTTLTKNSACQASSPSSAAEVSSSEAESKDVRANSTTAQTVDNVQYKTLNCKIFDLT